MFGKYLPDPGGHKGRTHRIRFSAGAGRPVLRLLAHAMEAAHYGAADEQRRGQGRLRRAWRGVRTRTASPTGVLGRPGTLRTGNVCTGLPCGAVAGRPVQGRWGSGCLPMLHCKGVESPHFSRLVLATSDGDGPQHRNPICEVAQALPAGAPGTSTSHSAASSSAIRSPTRSVGHSCPGCIVSSNEWRVFPRNPLCALVGSFGTDTARRPFGNT
jgi:hypothetical protein